MDRRERGVALVTIRNREEQEKRGENSVSQASPAFGMIQCECEKRQSDRKGSGPANIRTYKGLSRASHSSIINAIHITVRLAGKKTIRAFNTRLSVWIHSLAVSSLSCLSSSPSSITRHTHRQNSHREQMMRSRLRYLLLFGIFTLIERDISL